MGSDSPAIRVDDVSKRFRLYTDRPGSVKEIFTKFRQKRYEEFWALKNVSLEVEHGSVYGLVGHNGSGKSSLLKIMAGIHQPTSGRVDTNGRISALLELGAGFHPELTGRENIYLNASILGLKRREVDLIFDDIIDFSGLSEFVDSPVKHYSSGMFVRLGFSVAVHVNPQILIIDEVIAVGDEEFQRRCFEHLYKLRNNGVTIVMVSHSLPIVQSMCDRAAWFDHGHLMLEGTGVEVVQEYLSKVDLAEAERLEAAAESDPSRPPGSVSDRPILLGDIVVLGPDGEPTHLVTTGTPMTVRVHYRCQQPIESPLFSFTVETGSGILAAHPGMQPTHQTGPTYTGEGYVDYVVPSVPLGPGEYQMTVAVHDVHGTMVLDKRERVVTFRVHATKPLYGLVDLSGSWSPLSGPVLEDSGERR